MTKDAPPRDLLALAREAAPPHSLTAAGRQQMFGDLSDRAITPGQVWRAAWGDDSVLVFVTGFQNGDIEVIPVTLDSGTGDHQALVLDADATAFGVESTLWLDLQTTLPLRVFDEIVDQLPNAVTEVITSSAFAPEAAAALGMRTGHTPSAPFDTSRMVRAEIEDDLQALRAAPSLPVAQEGDQPPLTLANILGKAVDLRALVEGLRHLGLDQSDVMSLLRGKRPVTPDEVETIARLTEVDHELIAKAVRPLPLEFVDEVDHPRWRQTWRTRALRDGTDETNARLAVSYEMYARAARQTGSSAPDWAARLEQFRQLHDGRGAR
ncbi:hypothetical protein VST63_04095 [Mycolicibacterium sp. 050232]|uniref:hypothetical protein n=1 Tax=Mycolicibacterium sp. 050232 TaxID=3113982 RepID=UPI002E2A97CD|nr:hypothetical protein [Mycolicibacterium sp. 050232]MED5811529.1 hypothetical protein [Mycolicibacterium sp. 050232]